MLFQLAECPWCPLDRDVLHRRQINDKRLDSRPTVNWLRRRCNKIEPAIWPLDLLAIDGAQFFCLPLLEFGRKHNRVPGRVEELLKRLILRMERAIGRMP